ncbi:MAG: type IV pilus modification protein PilV [Burkholderiales bacterium]
MSRYCRGVSLIETLVAMLIFTVGTLGLVSMYARAAETSGSAKYRSEAAGYAAELAQDIAVNVVRVGGSVSAADLALYEHRAGGPPCASAGVPSPKALVSNGWVTRMGTNTNLPGSTAAAFQQVLVDNTAAAFNRVTIRVCWQAPNDSQPSRYELITYVN